MPKTMEQQEQLNQIHLAKYLGALETEEGVDWKERSDTNKIYSATKLTF